MNVFCCGKNSYIFLSRISRTESIRVKNFSLLAESFALQVPELMRQCPLLLQRLSNRGNEYITGRIPLPNFISIFVAFFIQKTSCCCFSRSYQATSIECHSMIGLKVSPCTFLIWVQIGDEEHWIRSLLLKKHQKCSIIQSVRCVRNG